jgi:hypothetical protein
MARFDKQTVDRFHIAVAIDASDPMAIASGLNFIVREAHAGIVYQGYESLRGDIALTYLNLRASQTRRLNTPQISSEPQGGERKK